MVEKYNMEDLKIFTEQMRATSSSKEKVQIIKDANPFIHKVLEYTYNPFKQYYVTSKTCKKNNGLLKYNTYETVFQLLDDLNNRKITGHDAIAAVNGLTTANPGYEELIYSIK
jgi:phosphomevalonate kinase